MRLTAFSTAAACLVVSISAIGSAKPVATDAAAVDNVTTEDGNLSARAPRLKEVMVTAQKFTQRAIDVPMSLAVISGPELQEDLVRSIDDLAAVVPGLSIVDTGTGLRVAIRGISNDQGNGALVGSYLDEADVTGAGAVSLNLYPYDLQRIEVLRGPQGTLYGGGSAGGTIRYITNKPVLDAVQVSTDATVTFDQYGAPGEQILAVANAPIVSNRLGLRVAADIDHEGGWMDQPAIDQKNVNNRDITDVRIEGLWRPATDFTINAMQVIHRAAEGPLVGESSPGVYTQVFNQPTTMHYQDDYGVSNLTMEWHDRYVQVLNSATRVTHDLEQLNSGVEAPIRPPPLPPYAQLIPRYRGIADDSSDELRLESSEKSSVHWVIGGFYRDFTQRNPSYIFYGGFVGLPGVPLPSPFSGSASSTQSKSLSAFGDVSYRLFNRLTFEAGVRDARDEEHALAPGQPTQVATFRSTDPRFDVQYGISGSVNIYTSAAKGFRSGGFNSFGQSTYGPESVWTYELGAKLTALNHRLNTNADIYWSNYDGYQTSGVLPPPGPIQNIVRNAGTARIKGVEASGRWSPAMGWKVGLDGDYVDARLVKINVLRSDYAVGDPLDMMPRYQINASVERDFSWDERESLARIEYSQTAPDTFRNRSIGPWFYGQSDHIYMLNFDASVQWSQELRCGMFVQNLLNDRGYTGPFGIEENSAREQPRTFGLEFNWKLE